MTAGLWLVRGDDREIWVYLTVSETDLTPRPLNAGEVIKFTLKRKYNNNDPGIAQKSSADPAQLLWEPSVGLAGRGTVFLLKAETKMFPNKEQIAYYDLQLTEVGGKVRTVKRNQELTVYPEVTLAG